MIILWKRERAREMELTGMPQLVEIPAPVTTMTLFDAARILAIFCCWRLSPASTSVIGMLTVPMVQMVF